MEKSVWEKWAAMLICIAFLGVGVIIGVRYLLPVILPFLAAWGLSLAIRPMACKLSSAFCIPKKLSAFFLLLLIFALILAVLWITVDRITHELKEFTDSFLARTSADIGENGDFFAFAAEKIPLLQRFSAYRDQINQILADAFSNLMVTVSSELPGWVAGMILAVPDLLLVVLITVIAGFYFSTAKNDPLQSLVSYFPSSLQSRLPVWKTRVKLLFRRFLRAYLLLLLLTFGLLLAGFLILGQKYAFLLALLIALVDLLPVFGVGTVLIPWAVIAILNRQYFLGVGLLVLYTVVLIVHQIAEPKLLGKSLGVHPVFALLATFAGWYLFGFLGMLFSPIAAVVIKLLLEMGRKENVM